MIVDLTLTAPAGAEDAATTMAPTPQNPAPGMSDDSTAVTAGLGGFLVVFALGLAVWLLGRDLTRRLRRMNRAEEQRLGGQGGGRPSGAASRSAGRDAGGNDPVDQDPVDKDPLG